MNSNASTPASGGTQPPRPSLAAALGVALEMDDQGLFADVDEMVDFVMEVVRGNR